MKNSKMIFIATVNTMKMVGELDFYNQDEKGGLAIIKNMNWKEANFLYKAAKRTGLFTEHLTNEPKSKSVRFDYKPGEGLGAASLAIAKNLDNGTYEAAIVWAADYDYSKNPQ